MDNIRPLKLPQDIDLHLRLIREGFQYPENPEWSLQTDEIELLIGYWDHLRRLGPILALLGKLSPSLHNLVRGYIRYGFLYEVDDQAAGDITYLQRSGSQQEWYISHVVVNPAFRRRGIAQKLVDAATNEIRARQGKKIILDVIDGNLPAYQLYKNLGYEDYYSLVNYSVEHKVEPQNPPPPGYKISRLSTSDWNSSQEFFRRTAPAITRKSTQAGETHSRSAWLQAAFSALRQFLTMRKIETFIVRTEDNQSVTGVASYFARTRPGGVNTIEIRIDPAHPVIAPFLLTYVLGCAQKAGKGQRITFKIPTWQSALIEAAEIIGAQKCLSVRRMGKILD